MTPEQIAAGATARPLNRQDVFSLTNGEISITWPSAITPEDAEDIVQMLDIFFRKIRRSAVKPVSEDTKEVHQ